MKNKKSSLGKKRLKKALLKKKKVLAKKKLQSKANWKLQASLNLVQKVSRTKNSKSLSRIGIPLEIDKKLSALTRLLGLTKQQVLLEAITIYYRKVAAVSNLESKVQLELIPRVDHQAQ